MGERKQSTLIEADRSGIPSSTFETNLLRLLIHVGLECIPKLTRYAGGDRLSITPSHYSYCRYCWLLLLLGDEESGSGVVRAEAGTTTGEQGAMLGGRGRELC
jgi:hypothetical protein